MNCKRLKVTIVTICFNCANDLERTIKSIANQDYDNIEYIIVDGGSADNTLSVINKYSDIITKWISEPDRGVYNAMNKGIRMATGEWINFMNAGDVFHSSDVISHFVNDIKKTNGIVLAYGLTISINEKGLKRKYPTYPITSISFRTPFCHQSAFIRNIGQDILYDENYRIVADYAMFYKLYYKYGTDSFLKLDYYVADYDVSGGLSKDTRFKYEQQRERINIRSDHRNFRWYYDVIKYFVKVLLFNAKI